MPELVKLGTLYPTEQTPALDFSNLPTGVSFRVLLVYPNVQRIRTPQLGLAVLSACLKRIGVETLLFDTTSMPHGDEEPAFRKCIEEFRPDLIGYSVRSNEWSLAAKLLALGRSCGVRQIIGGPHPTHAPDEAIPHADAIVLGEGEGAVMDIVRELATDRTLQGIANTWVNSDHGVVKAPRRNLIANLDDVPLPDWDLFESEHYRKSYIRAQMDGDIEVVAAIEGSRGCPFRCTYCSNPALMDDYKGLGRWRREKSPQRIVEELEAFRRSFGSVDFVYWVDEIFLTGVDRLRRFRDLYKERIGVPFSIMERPECVTDEKMAIASDAGLRYIAIGMESGDEDLRATLLNRHTRLDVLERALTLPKRHGVKVHVFTMVGLPGQDVPSLLKTWTLMRSVMPDSAQFSFFYPLKGTVLYDQSIEAGIFDPHDTIESYHAGSILRQDDVIERGLLQRYQQLFTAYAARPGIAAAMAFHVCRKSRVAFWCLFRALPPIRGFAIHWATRATNLLRCPPREAARKIGRNLIDLFASLLARRSRTPASR